MKTPEPKEKAKELVEKFLLPITQRYVEQGEVVKRGELMCAKQCAGISVDEILNIVPMYSGELNPTWNYWKEVRRELESISL